MIITLYTIFDCMIISDTNLASGWGWGCFGLQNYGVVVVVGGIEVKLNCG